LKQVLADQCGPRRLERPLIRAPLPTTYLRHANRQSQSGNHPLLSNGSVIRFAWKHWYGTATHFCSGSRTSPAWWQHSAPSGPNLAPTPGIEGSEVVLVCERNNAGLKKLSQVFSVQTSDSSAFLNATCRLKVCTQL
jgi:hypothetical protein